jgi:hypothetical protein
LYRYFSPALDFADRCDHFCVSAVVLWALTGAEGFSDAAGRLPIAFNAGADSPPDRTSRGDCGCEPARGRRLSRILARQVLILGPAGPPNNIPPQLWRLIPIKKAGAEIG